MLKRVLQSIWLRRLRSQGLQISPDVRLEGFPHFGGEPYLISIGEHVAIAEGVLFITHDGGTFAVRDNARYNRVIKYGRITVHNNCMLGARCIILPGVTDRKSTRLNSS